jgi:hypothetical protein
MVACSKELSRNTLSGLIVACLLVTPLAQGQQPSREYIRFGGRVIAIENAVTAVPISVSISGNANVTINASQQQRFTAIVTGPSGTNQAVTWSLSPASGSGSVDASGNYTAPAAVPNPATVTLFATSVQDPSKSANVVITIRNGVAVTINGGNVTVAASQQHQFTATVSGVPLGGSPAVVWSLSPSSGYGIVDANGNYSAPAVVLSPPVTTLTATPLADTTKSTSVTITIVAPVSVTISPASASVITSHQQQFTAAVSGGGAVTWSVAPASAGTIDASGLYTAPANVPAPPTATVMATSVADASKAASATVTIVAPVAVAINEGNVSVSTGQSKQFTSAVTGGVSGGSTAVTWSINPAAPSGGTVGVNTGLYTAPASVPAPPTVTLTATSVVDSTRSASVTITITSAVSVSITPASANVLPSGTQQFQATVGGTTNGAVTWSMVGAALGSISATGLYSAPTNFSGTPPPETVKASSVADPTKSATATVNLVGVSFSITPKSVPMIPYTGGSGTLTVTSNINWVITNDAPWLSISPTSGGPGTTPVTYSALLTNATTARTANLTIGGVSYTITQALLPHVSITPGVVYDLMLNESVQFNAYVNDSTTPTNSAVTWTATRSDNVSGQGLFSATTPGLLTTPSSAPANTVTITITATLNGAPNSQPGTATVFFTFFPIPRVIQGGGGSGVGNTFTYHIPLDNGFPPAHVSFFFSRDGNTLTHSCFLDFYQASGGGLTLTNDNFSAQDSGIVPSVDVNGHVNGASSLTLQNSQCEFYFQGATRRLTNFGVDLFLPINFNPSTFSGVLQQLTRDTTNGSSAWTPLASWTVPTPTTLAPTLSVNPLPATVSGIVNITGYAFDNATRSESAIRKVEIYRNGFLIGQATYGLPSTACASAPGRPGCPNVGFSFPWDTTKEFNGTYTLRVVATDSDNIPNGLFTFTTLTTTVQN